MLRRAGVHLLRWNGGVKFVHLITGESQDALREHASRLKKERSYLSSSEFLSQNTDGAGNPLARVYSQNEARELFKNFSKVEFKVHFLNKKWLPLIGLILPLSIEKKLASRWGWHLWIYGTK